jgi:hypothetical protein
MEYDILDYASMWLVDQIGFVGILIAFAGIYITATHFQNKER